MPRVRGGRRADFRRLPRSSRAGCLRRTDRVLRRSHAVASAPSRPSASRPTFARQHPRAARRHPVGTGRDSNVSSGTRNTCDANARITPACVTTHCGRSNCATASARRATRAANRATLSPPCAHACIRSAAHASSAARSISSQRRISHAPKSISCQSPSRRNGTSHACASRSATDAQRISGNRPDLFGKRRADSRQMRTDRLRPGLGRRGERHVAASVADARLDADGRMTDQDDVHPSTTR